MRLTPAQALDLARDASLAALAARAADVCRARHGDEVRTYVVERNINYTNVCVARCSFCAFSVVPGDPRAFVLALDELSAKVDELLALGGTQVLLQGGLNPALDLAWCEAMLRGLRERYPGLHLHAFSPVEVAWLARRESLRVVTVLERLRAAGLDTLPGGGAEILTDRARRFASPGKCSAGEWLDVMACAHALGIYTTATMMFGQGETLAERIEHLDALRRLQDDSLARGKGRFTAFTAWPFQPGQTRLGRRLRETPGPDGAPWQPAGAVEQLRMTALARLYLDNLDNIQASWVTQGPAIGQLSLHCGCNDLGSLMIEENVVSAAGTTHRLSLAELVDLIRTAGFRPVQRDCYYRPCRPRDDLSSDSSTYADTPCV